jgi:ATP-dependent Clp protease protease subunit
MLTLNKHFNIKSDPLEKHPKIILVRKFSEISLEEFTKDFIYAESSGQEIIPIQIDSPGGCVYSLLGMLDVIQRSNKNICTFTNTKAFSCGSVLLAAGTPGFRFASKNSSVLVHEMSAGTFGKSSEMLNDMDNIVELNEKLFSILDKLSGNSKGFFKEELKQNGNADLYYSPSNAVKVGLIDKVKSPSFEIFLDQKFKLL